MNSREKGARFERTVANFLKEYGFDAYRTAQHCGNTGNAPDVAGLPYIHIECKHYKDIGWKYDWLEQAQRDCKETNIPAVFHKTNGQPMVVTMLAEDWMRLYCDTTLPDEAKDER